MLAAEDASTRLSIMCIYPPPPPLQCGGSPACCPLPEVTFSSVWVHLCSGKSTFDVYFAGSGDLDLLELLISLGLSIHDQSRNGWDVFMWACLGGHAAVVTKLLSLGSNLAVRDKEQRLGLHWAAEKGHADAVGVLVRDMLQANLDIHATVRLSTSALLIAQNSGRLHS